MALKSHYTVVQCVPDPIAGERINIGVLVFGEGFILSRFLRDWSRVRKFAQEDIDYLREFADSVEDAARHAPHAKQPSLPNWGITDIDTDWLRQIIDEWSNSIQFTPTQPSLEDPDRLAERLAGLFLKEPRKLRRPQGRTKSQVIYGAVNSLRNALSSRLGATEADHLVKTRLVVTGRTTSHLRFDVGLQNGQLYAASQVLSFETEDVTELDKQATLAVLSIGDLKSRHQDVNLSLIAAPPLAGRRDFTAALKRFDEVRGDCANLGAQLVAEDDVPAWAEELASYIENRHEDGQFQ